MSMYVFESVKIELTSGSVRHKIATRKISSHQFSFQAPMSCYLSRDTNQNSRAVRCYSDCVEKIQDGGRIQLNSPWRITSFVDNKKLLRKNG